MRSSTEANLCHSEQSVVTIDPKPNSRQHGSRDDSEIPKVVPKARTDPNRKRNMVVAANVPIQHSGNSIANT